MKITTTHRHRVPTTWPTAGPRRLYLFMGWL